MPAGNVPPRPSEDIQSILSRFQTWTGKQQDKSKGNGHVEVREIPMEEAIEQLRRRRGSRATPAAANEATEPVQAQQEKLPQTNLQIKIEPEPKPVVSVAVLAAAPATGTQAEAPAKRVEPLKLKPGKPAEPRRKAAKPAEPRKKAAMEPVRKKPAKTSPASAAKKARKKPVLEAKVESIPLKTARTRQKAAVRRENVPDFRELLARSVQQEAPARRSAEREQRVSVRFSRQEEERLQRLAAKAGVTVSEYLRRCALTASAPGDASVPAVSATAQPAALFAATQTKSSVLGDWLALLRNRFLSSPARFAERA